MPQYAYINKLYHYNYIIMKAQPFVGPDLGPNYFAMPKVNQQLVKDVPAGKKFFPTLLSSEM